MMLPVESVELVLSFLRPKERLFTTRIAHESALAESKSAIRNAVLKWAWAYSEAMNSAEYSIPKIHYKRFYPIKYRNAFIESAFDIVASDQIRHVKLAVEVAKTESLVDMFNAVIDELTDDELYLIGW